MAGTYQPESRGSKGKLAVPASEEPPKEEVRLRNLKAAGEDQIKLVLEKLDAMTQEITNTTSLEQTIEIAKRVRTAKRYLMVTKDSVQVS